jgi:DNA-binding NarL/FixJ family response regulator
MSLPVLLADDHEIVRVGLRALLERLGGMAVVAEADSGRAAVQLARKLKPAVVFMDISMPDLNGIDATRQMVAAAPGVKVIALSMHADTRYVAGMLQAGARGYLLKDSMADEIGRAVQAVLAGEVYLARKIAGVVVQDYVQRLASDEGASSPLTGREREVLQLVAEGRSTKGIAAHLHVSIKTIETHRSQIMDRLDLHSVAELTKYAIRQGLTSLDA